MAIVFTLVAFAICANKPRIHIDITSRVLPGVVAKCEGYRIEMRPFHLTSATETPSICCVSINPENLCKHNSRSHDSLEGCACRCMPMLHIHSNSTTRPQRSALHPANGTKGKCYMFESTHIRLRSDTINCSCLCFALSCLKAYI